MSTVISMKGDTALINVPSVVATITRQVAAYLFATGYELYIIRCGLETEAWGSDKWRWYDPWSDLLLVY